ncbi:MULTISPECIES: hypothetical protein [unclassified Pseudomonas]|uniref:hypothetical protein n=1 Tax=unclassified Pseudomonas TaxID=196821 RepID=UPI001855906B|nr:MULTISPECIES: hypothetical protein [unclassified Pseudomonas]MCK2123858.1 hypothetical protein [Pseudomonas sp. PNPG3]MDY4311147.1 hypothetical protein [Pseudomonas putida]KAF4557077.1 hypothetical protein HBJ16_005362 [Pseudomonas sp. CES]MDY4320733.1 hypothetical protein [Pseudomonas putida]MDY4354168.1 hypothetical protein [Pseudomonas putida]
MQEDHKPLTWALDKVPEKKMAELIGITQRALEGKRVRGVIPEGVWKKIDNRIFYSIRRYEAWLEGAWGYPLELSSTEAQSASASFGMVNVELKPSRIPKPQRGSRRPQIYALK